MKLGSPKPQIFVNLEVRISILIGNAKKRIKQRCQKKGTNGSHFFKTVA